MDRALSGGKNSVSLANNALIPGHLLPLFSSVAKQIYSISSLHSSLSAKSSLTTSLQRFRPFGCLIGCGLADTSSQICRFPLTPSADELLDRNPSNVIQVLVSALTDVCKISSPIVIIKQPTTWLSSKTHVPPMNIFLSSHFTRIPYSSQLLPNHSFSSRYGRTSSNATQQPYLTGFCCS